MHIIFVKIEDCVWGEWEEWNECTKSCGGGKKRRSRDKLIYAQNGGKDCNGEKLQHRDCNCERKYYQLNFLYYLI